MAGVTALPTRDRSLLLELGAQRFLSRGQVKELLFAGSTLTEASRDVVLRRVVRRLVERGLVIANARTLDWLDDIGGRTVYSLSPFGWRLFGALARESGTARRFATGPFLVPHALMVAEIGLAFRRATRVQAGGSVLVWQCDWQIAELLGGSVVLPDARLVYGMGRKELHAFIEADRGTEGGRFFGAKVDRYLDLYHAGGWRERLPVWPLILTVTISDRRAAELSRVTERRLVTRAEHPLLASVFRFGALGALRGDEGPFGPIWHVPGSTDLRPLRLTGAAVAGAATDPPEAT